MHVFPLRVKRQSKQWPEKEQRDVRWLSANDAVEVVTEPAGRYFRYMKAIPMGQPCLPCHGPVATLSEGVKAQLAAEYPHDRAVDYQIGQVRGAVSIKKAF